MKNLSLNWLRLIIMIAALLLWSIGPAWPQTPPVAKPRPVLLEFGRVGCPICKEMEIVMQEVKARYGNQLEIRLAYRDQNDRLFRQHKVIFVPTQVFLDASKKEVFRHNGYFALEDLVQKLKELKFIHQ